MLQSCTMSGCFINILSIISILGNLRLFFEGHWPSFSPFFWHLQQFLSRHLPFLAIIAPVLFLARNKNEFTQFFQDTGFFKEKEIQRRVNIEKHPKSPQKTPLLTTGFEIIFVFAPQLFGWAQQKGAGQVAGQKGAGQVAGLAKLGLQPPEGVFKTERNDARLVHEDWVDSTCTGTYNIYIQYTLYSRHSHIHITGQG